jgi:hypothetical protein
MNTNFFLFNKKYTENIFLIDGLGALLTCILLGVLSLMESFIGFPKEYLFYLIPIALCLSFYSLTFHFLKSTNSKKYLSILAFFNFIYCCLTLFFIFQSRNIITIFGVLYFTSEIIIILLLVIYELILSRDKV